MKINHIYCGDALEVLKTFPDEFVSCVMTSPPYWGLRDYGVEGQLGLESDYIEYIEKMLAIFDEVKRVLRKDGTIWINLGDTYMGSQGHFDAKNPKAREGRLVPNTHVDRQSKCLCMVPELFALGMINHGWILRNKICWFKPNHMPSSIKDRFSNSWEYLYFFSKSKKYWFDLDSVREPHDNPNMTRKVNPNQHGTFGEKGLPKGMGSVLRDRTEIANNPVGKNPGDHWEITTRGYPEAHFAVYPEALCIKPIKAGCPEWICRKRKICKCCGKEVE